VAAWSQRVPSALTHIPCLLLSLSPSLPQSLSTCHGPARLPTGGVHRSRDAAERAAQAQSEGHDARDGHAGAGEHCVPTPLKKDPAPTTHMHTHTHTAPLSLAVIVQSSDQVTSWLEQVPMPSGSAVQMRRVPLF
jgi:hypothetical protein